MIGTFRHKGLEQFFKTGSKAGIQAKHAKRLLVQLTYLNVVLTPEEMNVSGWDWHPLKGNMAGRFAVSVSGNWRLTFSFEDGDALLIDYEDYH